MGRMAETHMGASGQPPRAGPWELQGETPSGRGAGPRRPQVRNQGKRQRSLEVGQEGLGRGLVGAGKQPPCRVPVSPHPCTTASKSGGKGKRNNAKYWFAFSFSFLGVFSNEVRKPEYGLDLEEYAIKF